MRRKSYRIVLVLTLMLSVSHRSCCTLSSAPLRCPERLPIQRALCPTGATVTIVQSNTQTTRVVTTKGDGSYREEFLPIGPYRITVEAIPGSKHWSAGHCADGNAGCGIELVFEPGSAPRHVEC